MERAGNVHSQVGGKNQSQLVHMYSVCTNDYAIHVHYVQYMYSYTVYHRVHVQPPTYAHVYILHSKTLHIFTCTCTCMYNCTVHVPHTTKAKAHSNTTVIY